MELGPSGRLTRHPGPAGPRPEVQRGLADVSHWRGPSPPCIGPRRRSGHSYIRFGPWRFPPRARLDGDNVLNEDARRPERPTPTFQSLPARDPPPSRLRTRCGHHGRGCRGVGSRSCRYIQGATREASPQKDTGFIAQWNHRGAPRGHWVILAR